MLQNNMENTILLILCLEDLWHAMEELEEPSQ